MALIDMKFRSETLGKDVSVAVLFPEAVSENEKIKVLWLLHGMRQSYTSFLRNSSIERYVEEKNVCVIMPDCDISYYTDMAYGGAYFTYLIDELPQRMQAIFSISNQKDCNYIAGVSMGGYGALKAALARPEQYSMAASLSGALDVVALHQSRPEDIDLLHHFSLIFGDMCDVEHSINDLTELMKRQSENAEKIPLYLCCGENDFLLSINNQTYQKLAEYDSSIVYETTRGCSHNWSYWDQMLPRVLEWMEI